MRRQKLIEAAVVAGLVALWGGVAHADGGGANNEEFSARLDGFKVTGGLNAETGAILTDGTGTFQLDLDKKSGQLHTDLFRPDLTSNDGSHPLRKRACPGRHHGLAVPDYRKAEPDSRDPVLRRPAGGGTVIRHDHKDKCHRDIRAKRTAGQFGALWTRSPPIPPTPMFTP